MARFTSIPRETRARERTFPNDPWKKSKTSSVDMPNRTRRSFTANFWRNCNDDSIPRDADCLGVLGEHQTKVQRRGTSESACEKTSSGHPRKARLGGL